MTRCTTSWTPEPAAGRWREASSTTGRVPGRCAAMRTTKAAHRDGPHEQVPFCDITAEDCPARVEASEAAEGTTEDF